MSARARHLVAAAALVVSDLTSLAAVSMTPRQFRRFVAEHRPSLEWKQRTGIRVPERADDLVGRIAEHAGDAVRHFQHGVIFIRTAPVEEAVHATKNAVLKIHGFRSHRPRPHQDDYC